MGWFCLRVAGDGALCSATIETRFATAGLSYYYDVNGWLVIKGRDRAGTALLQDNPHIEDGLHVSAETSRRSAYRDFRTASICATWSAVTG